MCCTVAIFTFDVINFSDEAKALGRIHNLSRGWAMMISLFFPFIF